MSPAVSWPTTFEISRSSFLPLPLPPLGLFHHISQIILQPGYMTLAAYREPLGHYISIRHYGIALSAYLALGHHSSPYLTKS